MATVSGRLRIQRNTCHRIGTVAAIAIRARAFRMAAENAWKCFRPETRRLGNIADSTDTLEG
ncbi:hypothetical protein CFB89_04945 [Burkholderia sp. AU16741]|nr:hypothetical protein CFB89_04945 [Burkholderia sp. AU16741]